MVDRDGSYPREDGHYTVENTAVHNLRLDVFLEGEPVKDVHEVNTREGWLVACVRDAHGKIVVRDGEIVMEKRYGVCAVSKTRS